MRAGAVSERGPLIRPVSATAESLRQLAYTDPAAFPVLLDSSACGALGRYSILAAYPQGRLWRDRLGVHAEGLGPLPAGAACGFLEALQWAWQRERDGNGGGVGGDPGPFRGGWMVFLGYELGGEIEPRLSLPLLSPPSLPLPSLLSPSPPQHAPEALALRVPAALVYDHDTGHAWVVAEARHEHCAAALLAALASLPPRPQPAALAATAAVLARLSLQEEAPARFRARVEATLDYIRAGEVYQANLSRPWRGELDEAFGCGLHAAAATALLYERLRTANPAPFAALAQVGDWRLLCSSPERLVRVQGGCVETRPIAGTHPRRSMGRGGPGRVGPGCGGAGRSDARERAALIAHPKERAEHVMLVDLERNDLGRICQGGSVHVDEMMVTESYAHVHHIVSNVSGRLRPDVTPLDVLRAVFPGGTITGCPKYRCMQIIAQLEGEARGAYTGALGFINHDGSMDFNILIRSLAFDGARVEFRAGAGIVADSRWQRELAETRAKARGLLAALRSPVPP